MSGFMTRMSCGERDVSLAQRSRIRSFKTSISRRGLWQQWTWMEVSEKSAAFVANVQIKKVGLELPEHGIVVWFLVQPRFQGVPFHQQFQKVFSYSAETRQRHCVLGSFLKGVFSGTVGAPTFPMSQKIAPVFLARAEQEDVHLACAWTRAFRRSR